MLYELRFKPKNKHCSALYNSNIENNLVFEIVAGKNDVGMYARKRGRKK